MNLLKDFANLSTIITNVNLVFPYVAKQSQYPMLRTRARKYNALTFVLHGNEHYYGDSINITTKPSSIIFIPKGCLYNIESTSKYTHNICIDFDTTQPMNINPFLFIPKDSEVFQNLFVTLEQVWRTSFGNSGVGVLYHFYNILNKMQESINRAYQPSWQVNRLLNAYHYIQENYCNPTICVEEIAVVSQLSPRYFTEAFRKCYLTTPMRYVTELRIRRAKQLLDGGVYNVTQIASLCGFNDVYCFSKAFRKNVGMSPTEYINRNTF